jgi:hypothetical protein
LSGAIVMAGEGSEGRPSMSFSMPAANRGSRSG